jgi:hypothetical protein
MDDPTWVAIYAAIVATSALLLNLRMWLESGPRLKINLTPDGMVIGGGPQFDETDIVIVNVTNRGRTPVLITNLLLWEMPTWRARWRRRPTRTFVVANTSLKGYPPNIPFLLEEVVFQASSSGSVCGGLQLRGATEWDERVTFIFEWCCQRCGPRPPHGPAAGPAIRPQPGHRHPIVEGPPQGDRGQTRGIEDTAFISDGFDFDNIGPVLLEGRPFPNLDRRQRKADGILGRGWNYRGEMLGFHGSSFRRRRQDVCGGLTTSPFVSLSSARWVMVTAR